MGDFKIKEKLGIIGCGNMGGAIIGGLCTAGSLEPAKIFACDPDLVRLEKLESEFRINVSSDLQSVFNQAEILLIAVKPNIVHTVLRAISQQLIDSNNNPLVISIVGGVTTEEIKTFIGEESRVVRAMPNLPCIIKAGVTGIYTDSVEEVGLARQIFSVLGETIVVVNEDDLDAVTGLSASGPAFVALMAEALTDGGVKMGLQRSKAQLMALQTLIGSARLILEKDLHPGQLKDMVTTPGGTTICGIHQLEKAGVRSALISAVEKATLRARERRMNKGNS